MTQVSVDLIDAELQLKRSENADPIGHVGAVDFDDSFSKLILSNLSNDTIDELNSADLDTLEDKNVDDSFDGVEIESFNCLTWDVSSEKTDITYFNGQLINNFEENKKSSVGKTELEIAMEGGALENTLEPVLEKTTDIHPQENIRDYRGVDVEPAEANYSEVEHNELGKVNYIEEVLVKRESDQYTIKTTSNETVNITPDTKLLSDNKSFFSITEVQAKDNSKLLNQYSFPLFNLNNHSITKVTSSDLGELSIETLIYNSLISLTIMTNNYDSYKILQDQNQAFTDLLEPKFSLDHYSVDFFQEIDQGFYDHFKQRDFDYELSINDTFDVIDNQNSTIKKITKERVNGIDIYV